MVGLGFEACPSEYEELPPAPGTAPETVAAQHAEGKAREVLQRLEAEGRSGLCVLGADTVVTIDGEVLGKPRDDDDAARMLAQLSGREHEVVTAWCLAQSGAELRRRDCRSRVRFRPLDAARIRWYVAQGEGRDKAGAYAVQGIGGAFIDGVFGSYTNVVGLPLSDVLEELEELGMAPWC